MGGKAPTSMNAIDVVSVLQIGFAGFAFLMAWLSFNMLKKEVERPDKARPNILKAIKSYISYTFLMAMLVSGSRVVQTWVDLQKEVAKSSAIRTSKEARTCRDGLDRLVNAESKISKDYESLLRAVDVNYAGCQTILKVLDDAGQ